MKANLTKEEAAAVMAHHYAMQGITAQISQLQGLHNRHADQQKQLELEIRKRLTDIPDIPINQWVFNLDPVTFEGEVDIPEKEKEQ